MELNFFFKYLQVHKINIDKDDFIFQLRSNPYFPNLLAISDTLSFFNIDNSVFNVNIDELSLLPDFFLTMLKKNEIESYLFYVEKRGESYYCYNDDNFEILHEEELKKRWDNIVFLVDSNEEVILPKKESPPYLLYSILIFCVLMGLFVSEEKFVAKFFLFFPILGILFSISSLKDLFGVKIKIIDSFCNITSSSDCAKIIDSKKLRIFEIFNFSNLSLCFFVSQFLCLVFFIVSNNTNDFFLIQEKILYLTLPFVLISIYYQLFIEKKLCPICLVIISIILIELIYVIVFFDFYLKFPVSQIVIFSFVFLLTFLFLKYVSSSLLQIKELKESHFKSLRFEKNYEVFKNTLLSKDSFLLPETHLVLGNLDAKTEITIITNPFCRYCKNVHEILDKILDSDGEYVRVKIIIKTNLKIENADSVKLFLNLYNIFLKHGELKFREAIKFWFKSNDIEAWSLKYESFELNNSEIMDFYDNHFNWCLTNNFNYTPAIFINGYQYPEQFDRENLRFFIKDIIEDESFKS